MTTGAVGASLPLRLLRLAHGLASDALDSIECFLLSILSEKARTAESNSKTRGVKARKAEVKNGKGCFWERCRVIADMSTRTKPEGLAITRVDWTACKIQCSHAFHLTFSDLVAATDAVAALIGVDLADSSAA